MSFWTVDRCKETVTRIPGGLLWDTCSSLNGSFCWALIVAGTVAAFVGSFIGARLVKKVTMRAIQVLVGVMLLLLGIALGAGLI